MPTMSFSTSADAAPFAETPNIHKLLTTIVEGIDEIGKVVYTPVKPPTDQLPEKLRMGGAAGLELVSKVTKLFNKAFADELGNEFAKHGVEAIGTIALTVIPSVFINVVKISKYYKAAGEQ